MEHGVRRAMARRAALGFLGAGGLAVLATIVVFTASYFRARADVQDELQAIRDAGEPVTLEELDAWYLQVREEEDAAPLYLEAFERQTLPTREEANALPEFGKTKLTDPSQPLPTPMRNAIEGYVSGNAGTLRLLREAVGKPSCRFPMNLATSEMWNMDDLGASTPEGDMANSYREGVQNAARLFLLTSIRAGENGDKDEAVRALLDLLAMSHHVVAEPTYAAHVIHTICVRRFTTGCEVLLNRLPLAEHDLDALAGALRRQEQDESVSRYHAAVAERCVGIAVISEMPGLPGTEWIDMRRYLRSNAQYVATSRLPLPDALNSAGQLDKERGDTSLLFFGSSFLDMGVGHLINISATAMAGTRCAQNAMAIERFRLRHGALPENMEALVPDYLTAPLLDPFGGKPLQYRKLDSGYVVYAGETDNPDPGAAPPDDVFAVFKVVR